MYNKKNTVWSYFYDKLQFTFKCLSFKIISVFGFTKIIPSIHWNILSNLQLHLFLRSDLNTSKYT